ncbi:GntR family transcriptional regulator [Pseudaminobacter arsenicus]|uniref:GntR family transcriptional regulator n=1 Tax=Borborobacter arsenicus TaxID=1851146 RepID=A0A432VBK1_9HYPH|nr:GntR family transcriptional regulator [Pseudaminobacter arsenicus]RUM99514.1 GntR family transcriptional regulator [Pseudaminobacter arsenicus]
MSDGITLGRTPVVRESLDRKAANRLRDAIVTGSLAPGTRLTEMAIAADLGLSRGTIRAALHRLASEGLVVQHMYSSWQVVPLSSHDAWELYTLRASLEGLAGQLTAQKMNAQTEKSISQAFTELIAASNNNSPAELADADLNLHRTIVAASGHRRLIQHYQQVETQLRLYIGSVNGLLPSPQDVAAEHRNIVESILAGNAQQAEKELRDHSLFYGNKLVALLDSHCE